MLPSGLFTQCIHNIMFNPLIAPTWQRNLHIAELIPAQTTDIDITTAESRGEKNGGEYTGVSLRKIKYICKYNMTWVQEKCMKTHQRMTK